MNRLTLVLVFSIATLFLLTSPLSAQASPPEDEAPPDIVVEVAGMSCPFCAYGIEKKFVEREEVDSVFVALKESEVRLWLKPGEALSNDEVRATVDKAGFTPGEIRRPASWAR